MAHRAHRRGKRKGYESYEIRSAGRPVALENATSPQEALLQFLRGRGCRDEEVMRIRSDALAWRGAVFTAALATPPAPRS